MSPILIMHFYVPILREYIQYCILAMCTLIVCVCAGDLYFTFPSRKAVIVSGQKVQVVQVWMVLRRRMGN